MYVYSINCPKQRAYEHMMATKQRFGKRGGNVGYHGYQSFPMGEATPEEAHSSAWRPRGVCGTAFQYGI